MLLWTCVAGGGFVLIGSELYSRRLELDPSGQDAAAGRLYVSFVPAQEIFRLLGKLSR